MSNKAFTLIELLVVISIIGVLSSVILVSFSGSRDKARLAKAQQFDADISHALGAYAVGIWKFEEGSGIDIHDESGFGNDGTMGNGACTPGNGNCPSWAIGQGVYSGTNALSFDGNDYVNCGNDANLKIDDKNFTLEAWIKPANHTGPGGRHTIMATYGSPGWIMDLPNDGGIEGYRFYSGTAAYKYTPPGNSIFLEWTHFVVTRILDENTLRIYLNGELKQSWGIPAVMASANPLLIGKRSGGSYFNGSIDDVRIYNEALTAMQIKQHYAMGVPSHGIAIYPVK